MYSFDVVLSPMGSSAFAKEAWTDESVELCRIVERTLRDSNAIDTESLCILAGSKVWSIAVTLIVLDAAGNLVDACSAAALASLMHFRRPAVTVDASGKITKHSFEEQDPAPLAIHHTPVTVSFGFLELEESELAIVDPTDEEENVLSGRLIFAINGHGEICSMRKSGGCPVESDAIMRCLQLAGLRATEIIATVETQVHESLRARGTRIRLSLISYLEAPK